MSSAISRLLRADYLTERTLFRKGEVCVRVAKNRPLGTGHGPADLLRPLCLPLNIDDSLYRYQRDGAAWLLRHPKGILADDMGLGKTAQAIRALQWLIRSGRLEWALIVAPRTLLTNWINEFERWASELVVERLLPNTADRARLWRNAPHRCHVSVTSYEQLRIAAPSVSDATPQLIIADEAHRLRTEGSITSERFRSLAPKTMWFLTGTPIENRQDDLAVLMSILEPQRFSAGDARLHQTSLKSRVRSYLLRRTKDDVLCELPPVVEHDEVLELTDKQRGAYSAAITSARKTARLDHLALFNTLRSICDIDPRTHASSKLDRTVELLGSASRTAQKVVVFSYLLDPLRVLSAQLNAAGITHELLIGAMSLDERADAIAAFKHGEGSTALLASMRVASEGLTLTEASTVVFLNRWWNPSANRQARDRVVRIGQNKPVTVYTFTCANTVEERIPIILAAKHTTFQSLVESLAVDPGALLAPA